MARTPLFRSLVRLASVHEAATLRGVPVEAVREELARDAELRGARDISRRKFLAGVAAGAAVLGLPRFARAQTNPPRIAIIGAGIAGLTAALTLQDAGYASTIYEASPRIGGRMHSNSTYWANGQVSEWCGELIDSGHHLILHLAQRFGLKTTDEIQAQPGGSSDTLWFFGDYYSEKQADSDFAPVYKVLRSQIQAAPFPTLYNLSTPAGRQLDQMSVYDWIETYVPGGHASPMGAYLDSAYVNEYGLDSSQQSSLNLVYLLGYQSKPGNFSIYGKSDERYHIDGGNDRLPSAIAAALPTGSIVTSWRMESLARNSDGSFALTLSTALGARAVVADRVILALPFSVLRGLDYSKAGFDYLKNTAITQLGYGTNSKLILQFNQRYWNSKGAWGVGDGNIYTDLPFQNTWDSTRGYPGATGVLVTFRGGSEGVALGQGVNSPYSTSTASNTVQKEAQGALAQLEQPWPGVSPFWNGRATLSLPWKDSNLLGSYSCWKVGQYSLFSGYEQMRQGKCHFAGEHCSILFQGYMEGGAQEGLRAANEILADYKSGILP